MSNVAVVVLDTVRALETVPADPDLTPTLAGLADVGTEYTSAITPAPWSLPAHASLVTGTFPSGHGAHGESPFLAADLPTLGELFDEAGHETVAISNNAWVSEEFGFGRGFDEFVEDFDASERTRVTETARNGTWVPDVIAGTRLEGLWRRLSARVTDGSVDDGARRTVSRIRTWLRDRRREDPFFLFVNVIEPHLAYRPPRRYATRHLPDGWSYADAVALPQDPRRFDAGEFEPTGEEWSVLRALYRAEIEYVDAQLGRLVAALRAAGEWEDTTLVVTSDHGENVGDYGLLGHQYCLYDTLLHVPMVATGGAFTGGGRTDRLVQLTDLAPTLLDDAGIEAPAARGEFQGRSFHPVADEPPRERAFAEYVTPPLSVERLEERFGDVPERLRTYQRSLRAVRTDRYKYVRGSDGTAALYDLASEAGEAADVAGDHPDVTTGLRAALDEWLASFEHASADESVSIEPGTRRRLSDLGYL